MFFMSKKSVGLDISDKAIEIVEIKKSGNRIKISKLNRVKLEPGVLKNGIIENRNELKQSLKDALKKAKPKSIKIKNIIFGLPKKQVIILVLSMDFYAKKEELILEAIQERIGLNKDEIVFSYNIIKEDGDNIEILVAAASKAYVLEWLKFFKDSKIKVKFFDIETLAIFRGLTRLKGEIICIVDVDSSFSNIAIFDKNGLRQFSSIKIGADSFKDERKISSNLNKINKELKELTNDFQRKTNQTVNEIILVGEIEKLENIIDYFASNLGANVSLGASVLHGTGLPSDFIEAIGLGIRGLRKKWSNDLFLPAKITKKENKKQKSSENTEKEKLLQTASYKLRNKKRKNIFLSISVTSLIILLIALAVLSVWYFKFYKPKHVGFKFYKPEHVEEPKTNQEQTETPEQAEENIDTGTDLNEAEETAEITMVLIKDTETGWLNVRQGPGKQYLILVKIYPGEKYPFLEEKNNWYKIELKDKTQGWILSDYATKIVIE